MPNTLFNVEKIVTMSFTKPEILLKNRQPMINPTYSLLGSHQFEWNVDRFIHVNGVKQKFF